MAPDNTEELLTVEAGLLGEVARLRRLLNWIETRCRSEIVKSSLDGNGHFEISADMAREIFVKVAAGTEEG